MNNLSQVTIWIQEIADEHFPGHLGGELVVKLADGRTLTITIMPDRPEFDPKFTAAMQNRLVRIFGAHRRNGGAA
jgi:hypothetical protein